MSGEGDRDRVRSVSLEGMVSPERIVSPEPPECVVSPRWFLVKVARVLSKSKPPVLDPNGGVVIVVVVVDDDDNDVVMVAVDCCC